MDKYRNKPPKAPAKYCRHCGKRIRVHLQSRHVETIKPDNTGSAWNEQKPSIWVYEYTGEFSYKRSEFFCTYTCAEQFAENRIREIDRGELHPREGYSWTNVTLGKGKPDANKTV